jgi:hypothetical protein
VSRKKSVFAVLLSAVFIVNGFCQTAPLSIADMDREAEKIAVSIGEFIRSGSTRTGSIRNERTGASVLDRYWTETIFARLSAAGTDNRGITIFEGPSAGSGYILRCTILELGPTLRIYTRLIRSFDFAVAATWTTDLARTPYLNSLFAGPQDQWDAFEPDGREQPVPLETGGAEISRNLHENDKDWFAITPENNGYIVVKTGGRTDTYIELYTGSFELIAENDDAANDYNAGIGFMAEAGKTYIVLVRGYSSDETGSYSIGAFFADIPDKDMEPNNSIHEAFSIFPDTPVKALILTDDDEDWYRLDISGGYFSAHTSGNIDTYLELFDKEGRKIANNDDSGEDVNANISLPVLAGTYYLKVGAYETGEYTLNWLLRELNQADSYEPDDRREDAKTISPGEEQSRTFTTEDDIDWVRFTVDSRGSYSIRAWGVEYAGLDTFLGLYDASGTLVTENDDAGETYSSSISGRELPPGIYYIRVRVLEYPSGSYRLSVTRN